SLRACATADGGALVACGVREVAPREEELARLEERLFELKPPPQHGPLTPPAALPPLDVARLDDLLVLAAEEPPARREPSAAGATSTTRGLFELADHGTLFLDEIGDMSPALQAKLLRVLQEGTFTPIGGTGEHRADVRVLAASHKDLGALVKHGAFREDLYYR